MSALTIGVMARKTGVKIATIRYYESIGLLAEPARSRGNQRIYNEGAQKRLGFIAHSRDLGFSLNQIRELLDLADDPNSSCDQANSIAQQHLADIKSRITRLRALQKELSNMVHVCAANGTIVNCRVIETLADHGRCVGHKH